jgi:hypothetical protein
VVANGRAGSSATNGGVAVSSAHRSCLTTSQYHSTCKRHAVRHVFAAARLFYSRPLRILVSENICRVITRVAAGFIQEELKTPTSQILARTRRRDSYIKRVGSSLIGEFSSPERRRQELGKKQLDVTCRVGPQLWGMRCTVLYSLFHCFVAYRLPVLCRAPYTAMHVR